MSLEQLQQRLDYRFNDERLLNRALSHRSYCADNNERMEYLGDSVLNFIVAEKLFHRFEHLPEGALSRLRADLVNRHALAGIARTLDLGACLLLGEGEHKSGGCERPGILSDALEAVLGAVYLDGGFAACRRVVLGLYAEQLAVLDPDAVTADPKTRLQEYLQKAGKQLPGYTVEHTSGPPHRLVFRVSCHLPGGEGAFSGEGSSRRRAEQEAAAKACQWLDGRERNAVS